MRYWLQPLCGQGNVCPLGWSFGGPRNGKGKGWQAVVEVPSNHSRCHRHTTSGSFDCTGSSCDRRHQSTSRSSDLESADLEADDEKATAMLAQVLSKVDFGLMEVVGQFNRGFIVARLSKIGREVLDATDLLQLATTTMGSCSRSRR